MSGLDASTYARLSALQARLAQPTPAPLEGQETIDLDDISDADPDTPATPPTLGP